MAKLERAQYWMNEAIAAHNLFCQAYNPKRPLIDILNDELEAHPVTKEQRDRLNEARSDVEKARSIIGYLANKYGVDKDGKIADKEKLFRAVYRAKAPDRFYIRPASYALGFYLPAYCFDENTAGDTSGVTRIRPILDANISALSNGRSLENLRGLSYRVDMDDENLKNIVVHELKHIIDTFIAVEEFCMEETSAHMLEESILKPKEDIENAERDIKNRRRRYNELIKLLKKDGQSIEYIKDQAQFIRDSFARDEKQIQKAEETHAFLRDFNYSLFVDAAKAGFRAKYISFMLPMTPLNELEQRLREIAEWLQRKKK